MSLPSVLGVFAHPDDESLSAGGVLARHAEAGAPTGVVTATWTDGTGRVGELAEALRILGAGTPRLLGYADARVGYSAPGRARLVDAVLDEAVGRLVAHIRDFRPEIVITHDPYGGLSGHPDHVHTHRITLLACQAAGLALYGDAGPVWRPGALYSVTHPRSALPPMRDLVGEGKAVHTVPDAEIAATVDVGPWLKHKLEAIGAHHSEVQRGALPALLTALPPQRRHDLLGTEHFLRHPLDPIPAAATDLTT